jgi:opacity protein-like surface antigen
VPKATVIELTYLASRVASQTTGPLAAFPNDRFDIRATDEFTVAGRAGFVHGQYLFYGRAGYASAAVETTASSPIIDISGHVSRRESGWLVGGGMEGSIYSHVLFGLEYNYIAFFDSRFAGVTTGAVAGLPFTTDLGDFHQHTVTARLSVLFNPLTCCARPPD